MAPLSSCPAVRFLHHHVIVRRSERKLIHGILYTNVPWPVHVIQRSSLSLDKPIWSPSKFGRCLEVVGLQRYVQPRMRVPKKSWLALNIHLHGIGPPAMDDNNFRTNEEVEGICETDGTTYCRAGKLGTGWLQDSPLISSRINIAPS